jgi:hypothetical protein
VQSCEYLGAILRANRSNRDELKARVENAQRALVCKSSQTSETAIRTARGPDSTGGDHPGRNRFGFGNMIGSLCGAHYLHHTRPG